MPSAIRLYKSPDDALPLRRLFHRSVHQLAKEYSQEERKAWAPISMFEEGMETWDRRLAKQSTHLFEMDGAIAGFISMEWSEALLDLLYTDPVFARQRVAKQLFQWVKPLAKERGIENLSVYASKNARPFFEKQGFRFLRQNRVSLGQCQLENFLMGYRF